MTSLDIRNPFGAPVYHEETVSSTMDVSRRLAAEDAAHGTVITADFQEAGRGRIRGREWQMNRKVSLPFTVLLRYPETEDIPPALTLRAGLAVSFAVEDFAPSLRGQVSVKWPNDIMIQSKKAAGILCEASGKDVHLGIGINVFQEEFCARLKEKATSIAIAVNNQQGTMNREHSLQNDRFSLLEKALVRLYSEFETQAGKDWKLRLEQRLYKKGSHVVFINGAADSGYEIRGCLTGITDSGELVILTDDEKKMQSFITGELIF